MGSVLVIGQVGEGTRDQLGGSLREELASMREQLDSLAQKIMELVEWQKEVGREMTKKAEENGKVGGLVSTNLDNLVEGSADKGMTTGVKYQALVLPHLKEVASKLAPRHLGTNVGEDLGRISDNVSSAASDIVNSVKETDVLVRKHYEQNSELVEQQTALTRRCLLRMLSLRSLLV